MIVQKIFKFKKRTTERATYKFLILYNVAILADVL